MVFKVLMHSDRIIIPCFDSHELSQDTSLSSSSLYTRPEFKIIDNKGGTEDMCLRKRSLVNYTFMKQIKKQSTTLEIGSKAQNEQ